MKMNTSDDESDVVRSAVVLESGVKTPGRSLFVILAGTVVGVWAVTDCVTARGGIGMK